MKASEMTNEELATAFDGIVASGLFRSTNGLFTEAAARLRNVTVRTDSSAVIAELQRRFKIAEDALKKCAEVQCDGCDDSISCEECDLACDGRCAQWMAKKALSAIRGEGGTKC